jgi:hypothetical protein
MHRRELNEYKEYKEYKEEKQRKEGKPRKASSVGAVIVDELDGNLSTFSDIAIDGSAGAR